MSDLVEFLRARLDEDERVARAAAPAPWNAFIGSVTSGTPPNDEEFCDLIPPGASEGDEASARHIARHDPARVLREVERDRRLLDIHEPRPIVDPDGKERPDWPERVCRIDNGRWMGTAEWMQGEDFESPEPEYCETLRLLALPYADHPDYQQEWNLDLA